MGTKKNVASRNAHRDRTYDYDVALSFAGEQREYVERVAQHLRENGVPVFYDDYENVDLWGKDLYEHLHEVYSKMARYCVLFASKAYAAKVWTTVERRAAQVRALSEKDREYILPARFDATEIPGLNTNIKHVDCAKIDPLELADMIIEKLGRFQRRKFLPDDLDRLYEAIGAHTSEEKDIARLRARTFFDAVLRMDSEERAIVAAILGHGCVAELPDNLHMSLDLLRRVTGLPVVRIQEALTGLRSLGIVCSDREAKSTRHDHDWVGTDRQVAFKYHTLLTPPVGGNTTALAHAIFVILTQHYCEHHLALTFENVDFGSLSSKVKSRHVHDQAEQTLETPEKAPVVNRGPRKKPRKARAH